MFLANVDDSEDRQASRRPTHDFVTRASTVFHLAVLFASLAMMVGRQAAAAAARPPLNRTQAWAFVNTIQYNAPHAVTTNAVGTTHALAATPAPTVAYEADIGVVSFHPTIVASTMMFLSSLEHHLAWNCIAAATAVAAAASTSLAYGSSGKFPGLSRSLPLAAWMAVLGVQLLLFTYTNNRLGTARAIRPDVDASTTLSVIATLMTLALFGVAVFYYGLAAYTTVYSSRDIGVVSFTPTIVIGIIGTYVCAWPSRNRLLMYTIALLVVCLPTVVGGYTAGLLLVDFTNDEGLKFRWIAAAAGWALGIISNAVIALLLRRSMDQYRYSSVNFIEAR